jgi:hypothetical protein
MIFQRQAIFLTILLSCLTYCSSHICVFDPPQRGGAVIANQPGMEKCYRKVGPCGDMPSEQPSAKLTSGSQYQVTFQQNLNHFNTPSASSPLSPGFLDVSVALNSNPTESDFAYYSTPIPDFNAMNQITQTNFTANIVVPSVSTSTLAVVRVRYVSNNAGENDRGEIFYQCSDVLILPAAASDPSNPSSSSSSSSRNDLSAQSSLTPQNSTTDSALPFFLQNLSDDQILSKTNAGNACCANKEFEGYFIGSGWSGSTNGRVVYDANNRLMLVSTIVGTGTGTSIYDGVFDIYFNFTNGYQVLD